MMIANLEFYNEFALNTARATNIFSFSDLTSLDLREVIILVSTSFDY